MHWGNKFTKLPGKINHLTYIDNIKLLLKEIANLIATIKWYSQCMGMKFDINICLANNEKQKKDK